MWKKLVFVLVAGALVVAAAAFWTIRRAHGFSARERPTAIEIFLARTARELAIPPHARGKRNPVPDNAETLAEGRGHWADHCAICHANNGSGDTEMGGHMYPSAPDMRKEDTQRMSDGELFYVIENGIRLSGMPAWGGSDHTEQDSWKLVRFIRHLPRLTAEEEQEMEKLNPKSPQEVEEEKQEQDFLNGVDNEPHTMHHH
ncbi:MAG TPA: c-type cytochrome [Bryobacteraceae bacterium]|jgi:mono/diheme cytochrome c family protein|nr:c-type cytochrome [Bryobacteraceae bacterium]